MHIDSTQAVGAVQQRIGRVADTLLSSWRDRDDLEEMPITLSPDALERMSKQGNVYFF